MIVYTSAKGNRRFTNSSTRSVLLARDTNKVGQSHRSMASLAEWFLISYKPSRAQLIAKYK